MRRALADRLLEYSGRVHLGDAAPGALEALQHIIRLHPVHDRQAIQQWCKGCADAWPCATLDAIADALDEEGIPS